MIVDDECASPEEVSRAIESLTDDDWLRLDDVARFQLYRFPGLAPEDLIQEGLKRVLDPEVRHWPKAVPFLVFFGNVLKSIAHEWREDEKARPRPEVEIAVGSDEAEEPFLDRIAREERTPEREALARDLLRQIENGFAADEHATAFLLGIAEGMSAAEVQQAFGLTAGEYDAARKRVARALERHKESP